MADLRCCSPAQLKSDGFLEPLNAPALPLGGLRQDHHGYETMPVSPADAIPFHANLAPISPALNLTSGGLISLLIAPDNSSIVSAANMTSFCSLLCHTPMHIAHTRRIKNEFHSMYTHFSTQRGTASPGLQSACCPLLKLHCGQPDAASMQKSPLLSGHSTRMRCPAQTYNVTLGGLAAGNEIYNVSVWFGNGRGAPAGLVPLLAVQLCQ